MKEEKNKEKEKKEEVCPLCKVSEETIKRLKEQPSKRAEPEIKKKSFWKFKVWFWIFIFVAGGFIFYQVFLQPPPQSGTLNIPKGLEVGNLAPDFVSEDVYGNKVSLSDFQGKKPVLLIFWATWCGYCAKELPDLKAFTQDYRNEIQVVAVDSGEPRETLKDYIQEEDVNFLMLLDEARSIWNQYFVRGTPSHFLIGRDGKIVSLRPGLASRNDLETMLTMLR